MNQPIFYTAGETDALHHAQNRLLQWGYTISPIPSTHVTHLLLPVPSFDSPDILKGGQRLSDTLKHLPENITIFGGNLPELPYRSVDFLKDEFYLQENAGITAQCALKILEQQPGSLKNAAVLLIGWGRISKRLLPLLKEKGAAVTVAVRKEEILSHLQKTGKRAVLISHWSAAQYDIIINTAPATLLDESETDPRAFLMDLASVQGITGSRVLWARGLPNKEAPEASGTLIAKTALRYAIGKE